MKKLLLLLLPFAVFLFPSLTSAQTRLQYPIPELGYCRDAKECYLYCEIPQHKAACWSYGTYKVGMDVLGVTTMSADEKRMMEEKARQYGITFPIAELGGCGGPQECRDYCEQPANQQTCMDFAKKKGFYKEMESPPRDMDPRKKDELLEKAKTELGCTSMESCSRVCESNPSRCETFARRHGVHQEPPSQGRYSAEEKRQLMEKATSELGCTSMESCKSVCEQNPQRCMDFARKHGFDKQEEHRYESQYQQGESSGTTPNYGIQRFGKGGCDSEDSCKKYCQEHPDECPGFQGYTRAIEGGGAPSPTQTMRGPQGGYVGPSGCRTEAECKRWCETNPDKCPGFREGKAQEESAKFEGQYQREQYNYQQYQQPSSQQYPTAGSQPAYTTTQPSAGSYTTPPPSSAGGGPTPLPAAP